MQSLPSALTRFLFCILIGMGFLGFAEAQQSPPQASPPLGEMATGAIEQEAAFLVGSKKFGEAAPLLAELISRLAESTNPQIQTRLEGYRYFLGLGYVFSDNWPGAIEAFANFLGHHPKSNRVSKVRALYAEALMQGGQFTDAAEEYKTLLAAHLPDTERISLLEKLAFSLMRGGKSSDAIPVLLDLLQRSRHEKQREQSVVLLAQAYIESNQAAKVIELLPKLLTRAPRARLNIDFNLALLNGGDKMFAAEQYVLALLFYHLTLPPRQMIEWSERLEESLLGERDAAIQSSQYERVANINRQIQETQAARAMIEEMKDFSEEHKMRLAQTYFSSQRFYEALWTFWDLFKKYPKSRMAEDSCFGAFSLAGQLDQDAKAKEAGLHYMEAFPEGKYWEDVSMQLGQVFMRNKEYPMAIAFFTEVLSTRPEHSQRDHLLFLLGFSQFQEEMFAEARANFQTLRQEYPQSKYQPEAHYWTGMTYLFEGNYPEALDVFDTFLADDSSGPLRIDAAFRRAVCLYALERYPEAAAALSTYVREYPVSAVTPEAYNLLGDSLGAIGRLEEALAAYRKVEDTAARQSQTDYATFQVGRIFEELEQFDEMEKWFDRYLKRYGTRGDHTQAVYRRGLALQEQGKTQEALDSYWESVKQYGNDPGAIGIDNILDTYVHQEDAKSLPDKLRSAIAEAERQEQRSLALRLHRVLATVDEGASPPVVKEEDLALASPAVQLWIGKLSEKSERHLSESAYKAILKDYGRTQWAPAAWLQLARLAFAEMDWKSASEASEQARNIAPLDMTAAEATMLLGDISFAQKEYPTAIARYEEVLQVKDWRGALWPESLYRIGESLLAEGRNKEAYAYFQRIYVLYAHYTDWTARAYLQCVEISQELGLKGDAMRTLGEMLGNDSLRTTKEYATAEQRLKDLQ